MTRKTELFAGSAAALSQVAIVGWLFCLSKINSDFEEMGINFLPLCALAVLCYLVNCAIIRRGVSFPVLFAIDAAMVLAACVTLLRSVSLAPGGLGTRIVCCVLYSVFILSGAFTAYEPTNKAGLIARFDIIVALMLIAVFFDHFRPFLVMEEMLLMCAAALFVLLCALIAISAEGKGRAASGSPTGGKLLVGGAILFITLAAAGIVSLAHDGVASLSGMLLRLGRLCISALKSAVVFLYGYLDRFMRWLAQFAKNEPIDMGDAAMPNVSAAEQFYEEAAEIPAAFYIALALIAVAALAFIVFRLRRARVYSARRIYRSRVEEKRKNGAMTAVLAAISRLLAAVKFRFDCIRYRKTSGGLLVFCEKRARGSHSRQTGESGERFLRRIAQCDIGEETAAAISSLAAIVEADFYSPRRVRVPEDIYRAVRKLRL